MTANAEQKSSALDYLVLLLALASVVGGIWAYYHFVEQSQLYAVASVVAAIIVSLGLVYVTAVGKTAWGYMRASRTEIRKVVWPTRQESLQTLIVVGVFTGLLALYLLLSDFVAKTGIDWIIS